MVHLDLARKPSPSTSPARRALRRSLFWTLLGCALSVPVVHGQAAAQPSSSDEPRAESTADDQAEVAILAVRATRNGEPTDANLRLWGPRGPEAEKQLRGSDGETTTLFEVPPGDYRVRIDALTLANRPKVDLKVTARAGQRTEVGHDFPAGKLVLHILRDGRPAQTQVEIRRPGETRLLARARTSTNAEGPSLSVWIAPGSYTLEIAQPGTNVNLEATLGVEAGETSTLSFELD